MNTDELESVFIRDLPDQNGARLFIERLAKEQPRAHQNLLKQRALLADSLQRRGPGGPGLPGP